MADGTSEPGRDRGTVTTETDTTFRDTRPAGMNGTTWPVRRLMPTGETMQLKNRVQWGPILAGIAVAITAMLLLSILGLAVGSTALSPRASNQNVTTGAAIWGIISAIIAFFLGGWVAAKSAAVGGWGSGVLNGLIVGCAVVVIVLWMTGAGIGAVLGTVSGNIGDIARLITGSSAGATQQGVSQAAQQATNAVTPQEAFTTIKNASWGTFIGIILPLIAAAIGGWAGHNTFNEVTTESPSDGVR